MISEESFNIEWKKCEQCGFLQHHSHLRCLNCKNGTFSKVYPSGYATLVSYTILKAPPKEFRDKKAYALGIVEFDNGIKAMGQISKSDDLKLGMKLKPFYKEICNDLDGKKVESYAFEPL